ncbi:MAG: hypothetical protein ABFC63_11265 [Thermoguttaceae bacterium]
MATALVCACIWTTAAGAAQPSSLPFASSEASTSDRARQDAIRGIPLEKLAEADRAKVRAVLTNISIFRRLPTKVIDCDPNMYLFVLQHPDVVVNTWEVLKASRLQLRQTGDGQFSIAEQSGAAGDVSFVYRSPDTHVVYVDGVYDGPLLARPIQGRGVLVLKTAYVRQTNHRCYIASRLDLFLNVAPAGAELLTKTIAPLIGQTADSNFLLTAGFVASLSRTAEVNPGKVQMLATKLHRVSPKVRSDFSELAGRLGQKTSMAARPETASERR